MADKQREPVEISQLSIDSPPPSDREIALDRYTEHKNKLESSYSSGGHWHRDSIDAYHRMGMTYNAYVSGEKINGMPVSKADVFISGVRFYQSNIFETAIIRAVKFACSAFGDKQEGKVETEQNLNDKGVERSGPLRDDLGAYDYGKATAVSIEDVSQARVSVPEYGIEYGLDTTKGTTYNSTDNLQIYQPTDTVGKLDIGDGKTLNIPGMRMVDIDGNRALVSPDGKVVHESNRNETALSNGDKTRIESRCDVFESRSAKDRFAQMAESRGMSVEDLKAQYTEKAMDAYASRIENQMLSEASRLETKTIPEARRELETLTQDYNKLDKLETAISRSGTASGEIKPGEIQNLKAELRSGMEQLENRITAMEDRVELLRDVKAQVKDATVEDRFDRAVSTEDKAVGRAGNIEYIGKDTDEKIIDLREKGIEKIEADIEKFNAANPESSVSYDSDSGELYNKYGVSESGKYDDRYATVDKSELPPDNPDSVQEYISKHIDTDFDKYRDFEPERQDTQKEVDTEKSETEIQQPESTAEVEQSQQKDADISSETVAPEKAAEAEQQLQIDTPQETEPEDNASKVEHEPPQDTEPHQETDLHDPDLDETPVETEAPSESAVEVTESENDIKIAVEEMAAEEDLSAESLAEDTSDTEVYRSSGEKNDTEEDESEARVAAANDDDSYGDTHTKTDDIKTEIESDDTVVSQSDETGTMEMGEFDISDEYKEILDRYFLDTENVIIPENDVIQPIVDIYENSGQPDFKEIFDAISEIIAGQENVLDNIDKFTELIDGFIEASPVPGEAYDMFNESMLEAGVPEEISNAVMEDMLSLDRIAEPMETGIQADVTIGEQELIVSDNGIYDAASGDFAGGFLDDTSAGNCFEAADQSLYDTGANVDYSDAGMESGNPIDTESLTPDFEMIQPPDVTVGDDLGFDTGIPETAVEVPGGIEGVEAIEGGAALEGIEAAAALLL
jgi:hypothetical protein